MCIRDSAPGAPWQRLNLRPDPHGHGALRAVCDPTTWPDAGSPPAVSFVVPGPAFVVPGPAFVVPGPAERVTVSSPSTLGAVYCRFCRGRMAPSPLGSTCLLYTS